MGRTKQPAEIIELYGKSHISKAELEKRKAGELRLEQKGLKPDKLVSADKRALAEFRRLKKLYGEIAFIAALDNHLINQYCLAVSELDDLVQLLSEVRGQLADLPGMGEEGKRKQLSGLFLELDQEVRLKRAAQYLAQSDTRISEIMYSVGFNSHSYFTKCFREHFGLSPKEYAEKHRRK